MDLETNIQLQGHEEHQEDQKLIATGNTGKFFLPRVPRGYYLLIFS